MPETDRSSAISAISTHELSKSYGNTRALASASIQVATGEIVGFVGPNGAGKSTLMKLLLGIARPSSGEGSVLGFDIQRQSVDIRQRVGYVPGDLGLYRNMKGRDFVDFSLRFYPRADRDRSESLAAHLEVPLERSIKSLSSGMRQKLGILQALSVGAEVLLLDEPTKGLDPTSQANFLALLEEERGHGHAILLSSHILGEIEAICDRIVFIDRGRLLEPAVVDRARDAWRRSITVGCDDETSRKLEALSGVSLVERRRDETVLRVDGNLGDVLGAIGRLSVNSIMYNRPSLEDIYRALYLDAHPEPSP